MIKPTLVTVALFAIGDAILGRKKRLRGALFGLVIGAVIGPFAVNLMFFDALNAKPIPKIVVGQ